MMTPRRIAYVLKHFPKLSQTFIAGELAELQQRGVELLILSLRKPNETLRHDFVAANGLDRIAVCGDANFLGLLSEFRPDLIHGHYATEPAAAARELAGEIRVPFTFTVHGFDIYFAAPPDFAERARAAAAVVTVSEANASQIASRFGVPRERICVIPCGVDTTRFVPARSGGDVAAPPQPLIVCVARHVPVKNLGLLLAACATLRDRGVSFRCVMIGDGDGHDELAQIHAQLKLEGLVAMVGAAEQLTVLYWLQRASVAALSSQSEGMPVALMEAGACGVPVVATRVGGIPELVEDGVTGLLTPPGDVSAFADALERLLSDRQMRDEMGRAARRRIEAKFSRRRQVDSLLALWSRLGPVANGTDHAS